METAIKTEGDWAVIELMGHATIAGFVTETTIAGTGFLRVAVPELPATEEEPSDFRHYGRANQLCFRLAHPAVPAYTKFLAPGAIYAIRPCEESEARSHAEDQGRRWEYDYRDDPEAPKTDSRLATDDPLAGDFGDIFGDEEETR